MERRIYLQLHLLVALFATTAIFGKLISFSAPGTVVWRTLFAALGAGLWVQFRTRRKLGLPVKTVLRLLGVGGIIGVHWMCFFGAIKLSNVSIGLAGLATTSFFTAFSEPFFERRRVRSLEVFLGLLVLSGILLLAGFERGHWAGLGMALASAMLAAVFPVLNRRFVNRDQLDPSVMVAWEMVGACLLCLVSLRLLDGPGAFVKLLDFQGYDWLYLLLLAWVCTVFAHAFHIHLLRSMTAYTGNLAMNFEPIYGILAAAILFAEHRELHPGFFLGAAAILLANFLHPLVLRLKR
jgi:drug/metabolite transporter (DMT)-like permease